MIGTKVKFTDTSQRVIAAKDKGAYKSISHAAASIRKTAGQSIRQRKDKRKASRPGTPPFTHGGFIRRALRFQVTKYDALIGFQRSVIGTVAATHEHGLTEDGRTYPPRPTMEPALQQNIERFHREWRHSIS